MQKFIIAVLVLLSGVCVKAQDYNISYDEAITIAIEQNLLIKREENQLDIFRADKLETTASFIPRVSLYGNGEQMSGRQFDQTTGMVFTQTSERLSLGVNATLVLFNGFNRINSIKQAQYNFQAQQNNKERIKQQVIFLTTQQFLQVLLDQELLKIADQNLKEQKALLERLKEFSDVGTVPITDYYNQDAEVKRLEMELLRAQNTLKADKALLAQTLQLDPKAAFSLKEPVWIEDQLQVENTDLNNLYDQALENRKDFKQQNLLINSENQNIRIARGQMMPTLSTFATYGTGYSSFFQRMNPETNQEIIVPMREQLLTENVYSVIGFSLQIPVLNNFSARARVSRAKRITDNQELITEDLKRTIFTEVQGAYLDYHAMAERYEAAKVNVNAAELAFNAQKERFSVGLGNLLEYNAANTAYVRGQSELIQAEYSLAFQKSILDYYIGTLEVPELEAAER